MNRFTKKKQDGSYVVINGEFHNVGEHINKFGQLEDYEEDLEVDLIIIFNALKNGIWYRLQNGEIRYMQVALEFAREGWVLMEVYPRPTNVVIQLYNYMQKYGEVWALTKEELEK